MRLLPAASVLLATAIVAAVAVASGLSSNALPRGAVVLDQQEIGTYEAAYDPHEELAVDNEYEAAMPFRDPGHISRSEIRLAHALARSGTTKRDQSWDFIKPLWGKYIKAMRDPTDVQIGWTNPRKLSEGADYLQTAVERHAYGAEGHREPERGFDVGEPASGAGFEWERDLRNGLGMEKPTSGYQSAMPHMMKDVSHMMKERKGENKPSKLETQVQDLHKMLQTEVRTMHGLTDEVKELRAERRSAKDDSLRQSLTYRVMKDKLVHSRLKTKIAEEKAKRQARRESTDEVRRMLAHQTQQMADMKHTITALSLARDSAAKHHRSRMSSKAAQQDLQSYFTQLDRQEAQSEVSEAKAKLAKLTGLLAVADSKAVSPTAAHTSALAATTGSARKTHTGSLLEATSLFGADSDGAQGLEEATSARLLTHAHKQQLAIVEDSASKSSLDSLVDQLKTDTKNEAPYLPL